MEKEEGRAGRRGEQGARCELRRRWRGDSPQILGPVYIAGFMGQFGLMGRQFAEWLRKGTQQTFFFIFVRSLKFECNPL